MKKIVGILLVLVLTGICIKVIPSNAKIHTIGKTLNEQLPTQVFRMLALEGIIGESLRDQSAQYLIEELLNYANWNNSTQKYVSYIHLLSNYAKDELMDIAKPCWTGISTKTNLRNEIENFLGQASANETVVFCCCTNGLALELYLGEAPNYEVVSFNELLSWLSAVKATTICILDSCYSGSWILDGSGGVLGPGRFVLASSRSTELSAGSPPDAPGIFGIFTGQRIMRYMNGSMLGLGVIGGLSSGTDSNQDGWISFQECFAFAKISVQQYMTNLQNPVSYNGLGFDPPFVLKAPSIHDVAVTGIQCKNVTSNSTSTSINVTVMNQGNTTETFNVTLYANTTNIGTQTVSLSNGSATSLTFNWNTIGLDYGNYTITAYATPVPGETDIADNNFTSWIIVTIAGDIDGNFKVQLADLVLLAHAYGSKPGDSNWNPNADIDGNLIVGLSDLVILAQNYGQGYP
jgi:hypothetical protein